MILSIFSHKTLYRCSRYYSHTHHTKKFFHSVFPSSADQFGKIVGPFLRIIQHFLIKFSISLFYIKIKFLLIILTVTTLKIFFQYLFLSSILGYVSLFFENHLMFYHNIFIILVVTKLESVPFFWGPIWEICGPILGYVSLFLENHLMFYHKIFIILVVTKPENFF